MEVTTENQNEPMFQLNDYEAYAGTEAKVWQAMRFFNKLEAVDLNELAPEDRTCSICRLAYDDPKDGDIKHVPIQLPCSHCFGREGLARWITPRAVWEHNGSNEWEEEQDYFWRPFIPSSGSAACPICRRVLFQRPHNTESAMGLEARLIFWDRANEKIGCLRSEKEEQSRADLIRYMEFNRRANGIGVEANKIAIDQRWNELERYHLSARILLLGFVTVRTWESVSPTQARLLRNLQHMARDGLKTKVDDRLYDEIPGL